MNRERRYTREEVEVDNAEATIGNEKKKQEKKRRKL